MASEISKVDSEQLRDSKARLEKHLANSVGVQRVQIEAAISLIDNELAARENDDPGRCQGCRGQRIPRMDALYSRAQVR